MVWPAFQNQPIVLAWRARYSTQFRVFGDRRSRDDSRTMILTTKKTTTIKSGMFRAIIRTKTLKSNTYGMLYPDCARLL